MRREAAGRGLNSGDRVSPRPPAPPPRDTCGCLRARAGWGGPGGLPAGQAGAGLPEAAAAPPQGPGLLGEGGATKKSTLRAPGWVVSGPSLA